ncbi:MAG TPA: serine/threonine-protein kinase [Vicinamibacterales bacterium]|nr:serine/threonine-protein kinase [Vicinamibacterales bacterium]
MIGQTVGKYRIEARLGRGGMGTVYRAVDETLDRAVAIKVLNPDLADQDVLKRFRAEAVTLAKLNHPHIAILYELTAHDGDLLMVMEFVRGETFDRLSERVGPMPVERAAYLCSQVLDALAHAHRAGIVHRDLKPANVMLSDAGVVKVMDFGIARVIGTEHLTSDGYMMGTPAYMAPEQVMGSELDGRADLYSVGVVLYRLLTGNLPFKADTAIAMVQKQIKDPPTPLRQFRAELPEWCEDLLARALAKAPDERFQTAEEFRIALARAAAPAGATTSLDAFETMAIGSDLDVTLPPNAMPTPVGIPVDAAAPPPATASAPPRTGKQKTVVLERSQVRLGAGLIVVLVAGIAALAVLLLRRPAFITITPPASAPAATEVSLPAPAVPPPAPDASTAPAPSAKSAPLDATAPTAAPATIPETSAPAEALRPPLTFESVRLLQIEGRRELPGTLVFGDRDLRVDSGGTAVRTIAYADIIGLFHSKSRDPKWVLPNGTSLAVSKTDTGAFSFLRPGSNWITVRTKASFTSLRVDGDEVERIIDAFRNRAGVQVVRARD